jgi:sensor histidine kinase YesM
MGEKAMAPAESSPWWVKAFWDPKYQFWSIQFVGWFGFALLTYLSLTAVYGQTDWPYLLHPVVQSLLGVLVSWPMRGIFRHSWHMHVILRIAIIIATVMFMAFVWTLLRMGTFALMTGEAKNFLPEFGPWYFPGVMIFFGWAAGYHGIKYYRLLQEEHSALLTIAEEKKAEELKRSRAEAIARDAQLRMLRYQLNPHFLFNTLNAVTSLVSTGKNDRACNTIDQLSTFLRKSLDSDPLQPVTLEKELETLRLYLEIEQTRFADRLRLKFDVDEAALGVMLPNLLLQPIAENAIKHAIATSVDGGTITVRCALQGDMLEIEIEDTGPGLAKEASSNGVGLNNTRERLQTTYGDRFSLDMQPVTPTGLRVVMRVPAETNRGDELESLARAAHA